MLYGCKDPASGLFRKFVRMSSTVTILHRERLTLGDNIWIGHFSVLDATGGLTIGEGVQIGVGVCIYTHGSHNAIRLVGREYVNIPEPERMGYVRAPVSIGRYTFIGSGAIVLPGVRIGAGAIIGPNAVVTADIPDRAILMAPPSRVVGNTLDSDLEHIRQHGLPEHYFDPAGASPPVQAKAATGANPAGNEQ